MRAALSLAALTAGLTLGLPAAAAAQDLFGSGVAVAGDELLVLKPGTSRGAAALVVFGRRGGEWREAARLAPIEAPAGEGFGRSMAAARDLVVVAAADADGAWAAHTYRRNAGGWTPAGRIPMRVDATPPSAASVTDFAGLMRYAAPPTRVVALSRDGSRLAVGRTDATGRTAEVVVLRSGPDGWTREASLRPPADTLSGSTARRESGAARAGSGFGAAVAIEGDLLAVADVPAVVATGAPDSAAAGGVVRVFRRLPAGEWRAATQLSAPVSDAAETFGAALAFDGRRLVVGAPGAAAVHIYDLGHDPAQPVPGPVLRGDREATDFGASIGVSGNELWIGSPAAKGGAGEVHHFTRSGSVAPWMAAETLPAVDPGARAALGASVAVSPDLVVAGAPAARGGYGEARIWTRGPGEAWTASATLDPGAKLSPVVGAPVRCESHRASGFECGGVDLLGFLPATAMGGEPGEPVSDLWGWTDPETKREYALVGRTAGVAIVDVTDPAQPRYLGIVPGRPAFPRDIKVYDGHMFFVGDHAGDHGLLVFDLTRLRSFRGPAPATFEPDARYGGIASAHNLVLDTETGTAIPVGGSAGGDSCGGGLHMVDVRDPVHPVFAGCYTDTEGLIWQGRTHDAQCTRYHGPDARYAGRDLCFAANETALRVVDITDRAQPKAISKATYPDRGYIHQGWLTEDQRYFFMDDEADELVGLTPRTRTLIWDVARLDDPVLAGEYLGPDAATDHNLYIRGHVMYQANYQAGLRVVDISDPLHPVEVGFFDTTPYDGNPSGWEGGAWTAFPFLDSGVVLVSSINEGLFLLRPRPKPVS